jgi:hypothetical protein
VHVANVARRSLFGNGVCRWAWTATRQYFCQPPGATAPPLSLLLRCAPGPSMSCTLYRCSIVPGWRAAIGERERLLELPCPNPLADWDADRAQEQHFSLTRAHRIDLFPGGCGAALSQECGDNLYMHLLFTMGLSHTVMRILLTARRAFSQMPQTAACHAAAAFQRFRWVRAPRNRKV